MSEVAAKHVEVGDVAPDLTLTTLAGGHVSLSRYRGRRLVVFLWASW